MKRLSTIIMALALVLGMSQCKKQETPATGNTNKGVYITVNAGDNGGKEDNSDKHAIAPAFGLFAFTNNDVLYVGHDGKFVGTLTFNNGFFSGTIYPNEDVIDQKLHFYFLGNSVLSETPAEGTTTSLNISIADQSTNLPVLSYGASTKPFTGEGTTYSTTLKNKCALVKFNLANQGDYEVTLSNVHTLATVNFANPTAETAIVATEGQTNANMTLYGEEGNTAIRWAILLPGTNLGDKIGEDEGDLTWDGEDELPVMGNNTYINSGLSINNPKPAPAGPELEYAVHTSGNELSVFSVSDTKQVYFSRGNLKASFHTHSYADGWSFHDTQFDEVAVPNLDADGNVIFGHQQSPTSGTHPNDPVYNTGVEFDINGQEYCDRFTWGYFSEINQTETDYLDVKEDLSKTAVVAKDWGCVFTETSPEGGNWRTLSADEWIYLFNGATTGTSSTVRGDKRFLRVILTDYLINPDNANAKESLYGVFVFPDKYAGSLSGSYSFNSLTGNPAQIVYGSADMNAMIDAGAVFLPCVGYRDGQYYYDYWYYSNGYKKGGGYGYYWSSTHVDNTTTLAKALKLVLGWTASSGTVWATPVLSVNDVHRKGAYSVRLVWDAN